MELSTRIYKEHVDMTWALELNIKLLFMMLQEPASPPITYDTC